MILRDGVFISTLFEDQPVVHGFTTRISGNLGYGKNPGDPDVATNRKALFARLEFDGRTHLQPKQVHSDHVIGSMEFIPGCEADAIISSNPSDLLSVLTADCIPILLYHPDGIVAAVHAGWRGLYSEIISKTLAQMPPHPVAVIGPAIGPCCYEVGEDLAAQFAPKMRNHLVTYSNGKPHLNLAGIAVEQLQNGGVEEIETAHLCTSCHPDLFFSYRRDGSSGRQMSFIGLKDSPQSR